MRLYLAGQEALFTDWTLHGSSIANCPPSCIRHVHQFTTSGYGMEYQSIELNVLHPCRHIYLALETCSMYTSVFSWRYVTLIYFVFISILTGTAKAIKDRQSPVYKKWSIQFAGKRSLSTRICVHKCALLGLACRHAYVYTNVHF